MDNNEFLRFPTQHGDFFVRPGTIQDVEDRGIGCLVHVKDDTRERTVEGTCSAQEVMAAIDAWMKPMNEIHDRIMSLYRKPG